MADSISEKRERLEQQRAKLAEQQAKLKAREKALARRVKELERPKVSPKQQTTIKVNLGAAVQAVILGKPEYAEVEKALMEWLAATNKSNYQRGLLGLPLLPQKEKAPAAKPKIAAVPVCVNARVDLDCPEAEKELAKPYGAKWDYPNKTWYVEPNTNLVPLEKWLKKPLSAYRDGTWRIEQGQF